MASLSGNVHYHELLAKLTEGELLSGLRELDSYKDPCLLPYLDAAVLLHGMTDHYLAFSTYQLKPNRQPYPVF